MTSSTKVQIICWSKTAQHLPINFVLANSITEAILNLGIPNKSWMKRKNIFERFFQALRQCISSVGSYKNVHLWADSGHSVSNSMDLRHPWKVLVHEDGTTTQVTRRHPQGTNGYSIQIIRTRDYNRKTDPCVGHDPIQGWTNLRSASSRIWGCRDSADQWLRRLGAFIFHIFHDLNHQRFRERRAWQSALGYTSRV